MNERRSGGTCSTGFCCVFLLVCAVRSAGATGTSAQAHPVVLPALNPAFSPVAAENQPLLFNRLIMAFARDYAAYSMRNQDKALNDGMTVYYLQRELQALVDMWWATGSRSYLDQATNRTLRALKEAVVNPRPLIWHGESRGEWPCFYLETVLAETGGHSQLCDFQGSVGFLMVARALQQLGRPEWQDIADFVERDIVEKWLYYHSSMTAEQLRGRKANMYLITALNSGRDVREHFACICLDLQALGYRTYPYADWAKMLIDLYLTPRYDADEPAPHQAELAQRVPGDWGLLDRMADGYVWLSVPSYDPNGPTDSMDTSHANRTAWLASRACSEALTNKSTILDLTNTFRFQIWAPDKGPFYFNNYVDGYDGDLNGLTAGRGGNVWFGWHRLAAFDDGLRILFLSLAYDLTNGGPNLPAGAQNKTMQEAPLCLEAWAARLLSPQGQPYRFP
jgi:hypothetical protein